MASIANIAARRRAPKTPMESVATTTHPQSTLRRRATTLFRLVILHLLPQGKLAIARFGKPDG
jgi:hypothetical protein